MFGPISCFKITRLQFDLCSILMEFSSRKEVISLLFFHNLFIAQTQYSEAASPNRIKPIIICFYKLSYCINARRGFCFSISLPISTLLPLNGFSELSTAGFGFDSAREDHKLGIFRASCPCSL